MKIVNLTRANQIFLAFNLVLFLSFVGACTWGIDYEKKGNMVVCPASFWVPDPVAAEFAKYPEGHPMREFFKMYANQQRKLDEYHGFTTSGVAGPKS